MCPTLARWIVNFDRVEGAKLTVVTTCNEHFAVGQQCRGAIYACCPKASCCRPRSAHRIVECTGSC